MSDLLSSADVYPGAFGRGRQSVQTTADVTQLCEPQVGSECAGEPSRFTLHDVPGVVLPLYELEDGTQTTRPPKDNKASEAVNEMLGDVEADETGDEEFQYCFTCKETFDLDDDGFGFTHCPFCSSEDVVFLMAPKDGDLPYESITADDHRFPHNPYPETPFFNA